MKRSIFIGAALVAGHAALAGAAITHFTTPAALEGFVGGPMLPVPDDGMPLGSLYGMGAAPLATPIGLMSFMPVHDKVAPGTYHAIAALPLAGSDIVTPAGTTAIDFMFTPLVPGSFTFTGIGSSSATPPMLYPGLAPGVPVYVGFAAVGESIDFIAIATAPFSTPPMTWTVSGIRVLPAPASLAMLMLGGALGARRRRV